MSLIHWIQASTALMLLSAWVPPRIAALRPHARRIGLAAFALYVVFAITIVTIRIVLGPDPFME